MQKWLDFSHKREHKNNTNQARSTTTSGETALSACMENFFIIVKNSKVFQTEWRSSAHGEREREEKKQQDELQPSLVLYVTRLLYIHTIWRDRNKI